MPSHRLNWIKTEKFDLTGYSVAGEESVIAIPELGICFDVGKAPEQIIPIDNILLTHGHIDHSSGIAYYLSHRKFCDQKPGRIFADSSVIAQLKKLAEVWGELDGSVINAEYIEITEGEYYSIKPNLFVVPFKTRHSRDSFGFTVVERRKKLRFEYLGLDSKAIIKLKNEDKEITYTQDIPLVSYTGDTAEMDFAANPLVCNSEVLIIECTFIDSEHKAKAKVGKHIHLDELTNILSPMNNKKIILTHFSQRTNIKDARKRVRETLPQELLDTTVILMDHFGNLNQ